jgi:hypothetical protein
MPVVVWWHVTTQRGCLLKYTNNNLQRVARNGQNFVVGEQGGVLDHRALQKPP